MSWTSMRRPLAVILGLLVIVGVVWLIVALPALLYPAPGGVVISPKQLSDEQKLALLAGRQQLQSSLRTALVQTAAGIAVAVGTVLAWRQLAHTKREALRQADEKREDFHLDLMTEALKSIAGERPDIRIGGLYALARLAELSEAHRAASVEVISAFVRNRSPWPPQPPRPDELASLNAHTGRSLRDFSPDVQAALELLGKHTFLWYGISYVRLRHIDLRKANLSGGHYEGVAFTECRMDGAWMKRGNFNGASFRGASLVNAQLDGANFDNCNLRDVDFSGASMQGVRMEGATFDDLTRWPNGLSDQEALRKGAKCPVDPKQSTSTRPMGVKAE